MKIGELFDNVNEDEHKTYVIAEIGINHEGSVDRCAEMVRASASAGADAIKLQTVDASRCYAPDTESYKVFSEAALTEAETANMFQLARDCGADVFTTSGDLQTLKWVDRLNPAAHKISSGLLSCTPIVKEACKFGRPVLISTGMSGTATIDQSVEIARQFGCKTALFQCTSLYPCPIKKLNLSAIGGLSNRYRVPTGFSDHSLGVHMAPLAVAAGARLIEKHITFDKNRSGFDHSISLETNEFAKMVTLVRQAETAMGQADKTVDDVIARQAQQFERRLAAAHDLPAGHVLTIDDLLFMRFSQNVDAIYSDEASSVVNRQINKSISAGQSIKWQNLS
ncbi:N-acetylneuraminate synthase family protein [Alphaproteobacteria bacterium]|nr:N-acetylneuraminate synthase family protein [Alphaproteobacteria bacterium]